MSDQEYHREYRAMKRAVGLCHICKELAVPGRACCRRHLELNAAQSRALWARQRDRRNARRRELAADPVRREKRKARNPRARELYAMHKAKREMREVIA